MTAPPRSPKVEVLVADLNRTASRHARIEYRGGVSFAHHRIEQFTLGNGLRVLVLPDHTAPVVSYHTWFRVGSRDEVRGKTGLAHLFEHLMFNETKNLPAGTFDRRLEQAGAHSNAATWNDWTYYYEDLPSSQLALAVRLESERMQHLVLRDPQVRSEKEVVANERRFRVDDDVDGAVNEMLYSIAFRRHSYHHPTIGWMKDINAFTIGDCREFYKRYYAPNNATVVIVGDVRMRRALTLMQTHYGSIAPSVIKRRSVPKESAQKTERSRTIRRPTPSPKIAVGYRGPALSDDDHAPLSVLSDALFGGRSSRLFRLLVTEQELASELNASVSSFRDPGLFEIYLTAREGVPADRLQRALDRGLDRVHQAPITDEERDRAVARMELSFLQGLESVGGRADTIGFFDTVLGDPAGSLRRLETLRAVTPADIARVAGKYLRRTNRTRIVVLPSASVRAKGAAA